MITGRSARWLAAAGGAVAWCGPATWFAIVAGGALRRSTIYTEAASWTEALLALVEALALTPWLLLWAGSAVLALLVKRSVGRDVVRAHLPLRFWSLGCPMFLGLLVVATAFAGEAGRFTPPTHFVSPEMAAEIERAAQAGLTASMTDEQLLRALGEDPSALRTTVNCGACGCNRFYSSAATGILIMRSGTTGVGIIRRNADLSEDEWTLGYE